MSRPHFWNLCDLCTGMSVFVLSFFSCMHSFGLGLDLGNSSDRREGECTRAYMSHRTSVKKATTQTLQFSSGSASFRLGIKDSH